jgi:transposase-like protein
MSKEKRRQFSADKKAEILRRHLVDKVAVSDLCDEYRIQPSLFYTWLRQMMGNLEAALQDGRSQSRGDGELQKAQEKIQALESKLARKDAVIALISEEHLKLKKTLGLD